jgi:hypothetical protein
MPGWRNIFGLLCASWLVFRRFGGLTGLERLFPRRGGVFPHKVANFSENVATPNLANRSADSDVAG